jgi:hypothetical protein
MTIDEELEMTRQNNQVALRIAWKNFVDVEKEKF